MIVFPYHWLCFGRIGRCFRGITIFPWGDAEEIDSNSKVCLFPVWSCWPACRYFSIESLVLAIYLGEKPSVSEFLVGVFPLCMARQVSSRRRWVDAGSQSWVLWPKIVVPWSVKGVIYAWITIRSPPCCCCSSWSYRWFLEVPLWFPLWTSEVLGSPTTSIRCGWDPDLGFLLTKSLRFRPRSRSWCSWLWSWRRSWSIWVRIRWTVVRGSWPAFPRFGVGGVHAKIWRGWR